MSVLGLWVDPQPADVESWLDCVSMLELFFILEMVNTQIQIQIHRTETTQFDIRGW